MRVIKGFTLLEVLVVLVIVSLLVTFLFQTLSHVLTTRNTILRQLNTFQQGAIQEFWFRHSTAGLVADYPDIELSHVFKGEATGFTGLTTTALNADPGVPIPFGWSLVEQNNETQLQYQTATETWTVLTWQEAEGRFQYLDNEGEWSDAWPPDKFGLEPPQLPEAILLNAQRGRQPITWLVSMNARRVPKRDGRLLAF